MCMCVYVCMPTCVIVRNALFVVYICKGRDTRERERRRELCFLKGSQALSVIVWH